MLNKYAISLLSCLFAIALPSAAFAETVMEKAARTGSITLGTRTDIIPYAYLNDKQELVGYSMDVVQLIEREISSYLGRPVTVQVKVINEFAELLPKVATGEVDLACNTQFTWEREMYVDYSLPYSLSGIRLLTKKGSSITGTPASLVGKRVAVLPNSLGETAIKVVQTKAVPVLIKGVDAGIEALVSGKVDAVAGDTIVLAGNIQRVSETGYQLVPADPYVRYAVGCMVPENNSTFRNVVNLAIAKMLQGYVVGEAKYTALVNKWMGPKGIVELPTELIRGYFEMVLLNHEQIALPATSTATKSEK